VHVPTYQHSSLTTRATCRQARLPRILLAAAASGGGLQDRARAAHQRAWRALHSGMAYNHLLDAVAYWRSRPRRKATTRPSALAALAAKGSPLLLAASGMVCGLLSASCGPACLALSCQPRQPGRRHHQLPHCPLAQACRLGCTTSRLHAIHQAVVANCEPRWQQKGRFSRQFGAHATSAPGAAAVAAAIAARVPIQPKQALLQAQLNGSPPLVLLS